LLVQLKWIAGDGSAGVQALAPRQQWRERLSWIAAGTLAMVVIALAISKFRQQPTEAALVRFQVQPPQDFRYAQFDLPVASPDGRHVAFVGSMEASEVLADALADGGQQGFGDGVRRRGEEREGERG
jgi:hypothetical protein